MEAHQRKIAWIATVPDAGPFHNFPYEYGVFFTYGALSWLDSFGGASLKKDPSWLNRLNILPVADLMERLCEKESESYREWIRHDCSDAYWEKADYLDRLDSLKIPVFLQGGWFDTATNGVKLAYQGLQGAGNPNIKMIVGPWAHSAKSATRLAGMDFGEAAGIDLYRLYSRWFDCWLRGADNGILKEPRVQLFLMGPNCWLKGDAYPLPGTDLAEFHLASETGANTSKGDGNLHRRPHCSKREFDSYVYHPGDPTPGVTSRMRQGGMKGYANITGARNDILVFDTAPLDEPLNIAGPISVKLYASSTARDTDWVAYLAALDESDTLVPIGRGMGMLRARFRDSLHRPELLVKGKIYEYTLDLWQTGRQIPKGWKLRLEISSAYAPTFSRNLNTGGHNEMDTQFVRAEQKVYHSVKYPSRLILPLVDLRDHQ